MTEHECNCNRIPSLGEDDCDCVDDCDCGSLETIDIKEPVARYLVLTPFGNFWADETLEQGYGVDFIFEYTKEKDDPNRSWKTSVHTESYAIMDFEDGQDVEAFRKTKADRMKKEHLKDIV